MKNLFWSLFALIASAGMFSCELEEKINQINSIDEGVEALQEYAIVSKQFQDASNSSDNSVITAEVEFETAMASELKASTEGPVITIEPMDNSWPKNITVDFGDGVIGKDGIKRSGKLNIISTDWYRMKDSKHTTTYENFYQNGYKVEGTNVATNLGMVEGEGLQFNVVIADGKVSKNGAVINYTQNTTRTWVKGDDTPIDIWDDEYKLDGIQNGVSSKGIKYELDITEPLHFIVLSKEITEGKIAVDIEGLPDMELDYTESKIRIGEQSFPMNQ